MSEADGAPHGDRFRFKVRGPRDFYGGLALVGLAIFAIWAASDLPGQQGFAFGAGTAPRLFSGLLAAIGALVALNGLLFDGPPLEGYALRGPALVVAAILAFAAMISGCDLYVFHLPPLGLVVSTFAAYMIAVLGSREMRLIESLLSAAAMTVFCVVVFVYVLELPFRLWPGV
jgi:putative tricarboxylic transport membrane protein